MKAKGIFWAILSSTVLLTGCAGGSLTGDTYSRDEARSIQTVKTGTIVSARPVVIEGRSDGVVGTLGGAAIGGIAGNQVGGGSGRQIAAVVGSIVGGIIGQNIEEKATRAQGQELGVRLSNGEVISIVQEVDQANFFRINDRVRILEHNGTARVSY